MISKDCKNCDCLDEDNKNYPCKLEYPIRCNILYQWVNNHTLEEDSND